MDMEKNLVNEGKVLKILRKGECFMYLYKMLEDDK